MGSSSRALHGSSPWMGGLAAGLLALGAAACGSSETAGDVAVFTEISATDGGLEADLARCAQLTDPSLAGDCALVVAARSSEAAEALCPRVPEGLWRDECWFVKAEARAKGGQTQSAAQLCLKAGAFADDCGQHLWQGEVHELIASRGPEAFPRQLEKAEQLHDRWARLLADQTDFSVRFWDKFYGNGFEGQGGVDLGYCAVLEEPHRARCRRAGVAYFRRDLGPKLDQAGMAAAFCGSEPLDLEALGKAFPNRPDPALEAVLTERRGSLCPQ